MKKLLTLFKIELKLTLRSPDTLLFVLLMPVVIVTIMRLISEDNTVLQSNMGAYMVIGICAIGLMGLPLTLSEYRGRKILKQMQVTPATPKLLLGTQLLVQGLVAVISALLVILVTTLLFGVSLQVNLYSFLLSWFLVLVSIFAIGMVICSISRDIKQAGILCSIIYFPMLLLSGTTIPYSKFPKLLQGLGNFLPLRQGINLIDGILTGGLITDYLFEVVILLIITILGTAISIKWFRWEI